MNVTITIPEHLVPTSVSDLKRWALDIAVAAARQGIEPIVPDKSGRNHTLKTYLGHSTLSAMPRLTGIPVSDCVAGLVNAWVLRQRAESDAQCRKAASDAAPKAATADVKNGLRPEQLRLIEHAESAAALGSIVFSEAGTGVGKTMAAMVICARYADRTGRPAVFAVPTLNVLGQAVDEYKALEAEVMGLKRKPSMAFLIGRGSFVDPVLLRDILENPGEIMQDVLEPVRAWMASGARYTTGAKTERLHRAVPDLAWLVDDLQHAAPGFPADQVRLGEENSEDCPAQALYARFREAALGAEIVICTHAMLGIDTMISARTPSELRNRLVEIDHRLQVAIDNKRKTVTAIQREKARAVERLKEAEEAELEGQISSPVLPRYGFLAIDEAHQFEVAIANLRSSDVNPRLLASQIAEKMAVFAKCRHKTRAERLVGVLEQMHSNLTVLGKGVKDERVRLNGPPEVVHRGAAEALKPYFDKIAQLKLVKLTRDCPASRPLLNPLLSLVRNMRETGDGVWLNFSPRRKYPSLQTGPRTVKPILERIWDRVESAVLLSATLALPDNNGQPRVGFLSMELSVPSLRMKAIPPIVQKWLYTPVLYPVGKGRSDLRPPKDAEEHIQNRERIASASMIDWARSIAGEIRHTADTAPGGILALTSSYDRIKAVAAALDDLGDRLVVQSRRTGVRGAQAEFEQKARTGLRPIWIGAGPAWTGLDISDKSLPAHEDYMLTDLVVINVPFGTNRSSTHQARVEWLKTAERDRAALEFKQGIGRLMRREGLRDRRLHILDPRVWDAGGWFLPFRKILEGYKTAG